MEGSFDVEKPRESFLIGDVARIFGIPASTLRFWEKQGLVKFPRDERGGGYRKFSFLSLVDVADVVFARDVGMPISEVKTFREKDPQQLGDLLDDLEDETMHKIAELGCVMEEIHKRRRPIKEWQMLTLQPIHRVRAKLPAIYVFDFADESMVREYLHDSSQAIDIIPSEDPASYKYGRFMEQSDWPQLRGADSVEKTYLHGCMWMNPKRETNVREFWDEAERLGLRYGNAISRFLFSADKEGQGYCYFFETWLEVFADGES